jgi:hypothetical protein
MGDKDNNTLELAQNPTAVKLRGLLSSPGFQQLKIADPKRAQQVYQFVAGTGPAPIAMASPSAAPSGTAPGPAAPGPAAGPAVFRRPLSQGEQMQMVGIRSTLDQ